MSAPLPESAASAPSVEPRICVVIPTRDRPALALRAARSALAQRGVDVRVVLVDDGSKTPLSEGLGLDDPRVVIVRQPVSLGVAAARNRGIASSDAPWLAFLDDDDVWAPEKLRCQIDAATAVGAEWCISSSLQMTDALAAINTHTCPPTPEAVLKGLCTYNAVPGGGSGVIVSQLAIRAVGGFDETLSMCADWEMWHRLAHRSPCAIVAEVMVGYMIHEQSMTSRFLDHSGEILRMDALVSRYCDGSKEERRNAYFTWLAVSTSKFSRTRSARILLGVARRRRSPRLVLIATRVWLIPPTFSIRQLTRVSALPVPVATPEWVSRIAAERALADLPLPPVPTRETVGAVTDPRTAGIVGSVGGNSQSNATPRPATVSGSPLPDGGAGDTLPGTASS